MSDQMLIPGIELNGSVIRITQVSTTQERSILTIPVDAVDDFCESLYWARKQYLTQLNEEERATESGSSGSGQPPEDLMST
jgi:hypothetical protein